MTANRALTRAAEVALVAITLAAVLGMTRLFASTGWMGPLLANAVAAHGLATLLRHRHVGLAASAGTMAVGAALVISWSCYWSTTLAGLPTGDTLSGAHTDLSAAWRLYQDAVAPTPLQTGYVVASALAIWCIAYVADWAAFRLWVPFEATLPAATLFLFTALLGADRGRAWAVALYASALLAFLLLHRLARQDGSSHWVAERRTTGHRSLLTAGTALAAVAVIAGTLIGPNLPGADSPGVLDPKDLNDGNDPRVTISPLVDIRSRLVDQSNVEVFTVHSTQRSYWRLTSLERFDGRIWSSSGSYGKAKGTLPKAEPTKVNTAEVDQTFSITALAAIWLPSAYEPHRFTGKGLDVRYDEDSATLIVDSSVPTSDGLTYEVESASPRITPEDLTGTSGEVPSSIRSRFTGLPSDFSPRVRQLAAQVTASARTPYAQARALQDYLRTFTYDLTVPAGHSGDDLEHFLFDTKRGYCEQFAGAFGAMARSLGLPARVAVGFTPGELDPSRPDTYHVLGEHAHAWPEVYFAGAGWVAFEPTPGRGMPAAESYTGVPESQAADGSPATATTLTPTTVAGGTGGSQGSAAPQNPGKLDAGGGAPTKSNGGGDGSLVERFGKKPVRRALPFVLGAVLLYLLAVPGALSAHRRRRRRRAGTPSQRIALAWIEASEGASMVGFGERSSDTYDETARRLADALPQVEEPAAVLARARETADYSPDGAAGPEVDAATAASGEITAAAWSAAPYGERLRRWLDPRPELKAWRRSRAAGQRRITTVTTTDHEPERELVGTSDLR
jgi:transglutaminase-like putative cysteine protease